ncbi:hypothetical protein EJ02DRAFT_466081 [Clathrospora elynae]|uniref:Uncharacterized protein n=1 Tax=Clathrospora elynae TaxID=706981 RepID=A0A6A5SQW9_9PLEO|nr:hypothetical protein EJ02DRAFT_466081 [Clathrospora elynae]
MPLFGEKNPHAPYEYKSTKAQNKAHGQLADYYNCGRRPKPEGGPGHQFTAYDENNFPHFMIINEQGRVELFKGKTPHYLNTPENNRELRRQAWKENQLDRIGMGDGEAMGRGARSQSDVGPQFGGGHGHGGGGFKEELEPNYGPYGATGFDRGFERRIQQHAQRQDMLQQLHGGGREGAGGYRRIHTAGGPMQGRMYGRPEPMMRNMTEPTFGAGSISVPAEEEGGEMHWGDAPQVPQFQLQAQSLPQSFRQHQQLSAPQQISPPQQPAPTQPQTRQGRQPRKPFVNPMLTHHEPLGANGIREHVPGQTQLKAEDFGKRPDEPSAGWRMMQALEELKRKNAKKEEGERRWLEATK